MTLVQLQHFRTLAYVLHYTKASEQLHIAQPSLSYSISELEKELGAKLFIRADRKICLTEYGQSLFFGFSFDCSIHCYNSVIGQEKE